MSEHLRLADKRNIIYIDKIIEDISKEYISYISCKSKFDKILTVE